MNQIEIIEFVNSIENKYPVQNWSINRVKVWPLIRIKLCFYLYNYYSEPIQKGQAINGKILALWKLVSKNLNFIKSYFSDFNKNARVSSKKKYQALFLTITVDRIRIGNKYYNKFYDHLEEEFEKAGISTITFERAAGEQFLTPRHKSSYFFQHKIDSLNFLRKLARSKSYNVDMQDYDQFLSDIRQMGYDEGVFSISAISNQFSFVWKLRNYFLKVIQKHQIKMVFATDYYNPVTFGLTLAARAAGIVSVDIQHGSQGDYHYAYGKWNNVPENGYELLPSTFFVWSETEKNALNKWNQLLSEKHDIVITGPMWLDQWLHRKTSFVVEIDNLVKREKDRYPKGKKHLLITLWNEPMYDWLYEVIKESEDTYIWWVREHPCYIGNVNSIKEFTALHQLKNVVDPALVAEVPIHAILNNIDMHLTKASTTVIEAARFNVPSIILHFEGAKMFEAEVMQGIAKTAFDKNELLAQLKTSFSDEFIQPGYPPVVEYGVTKYVKQKILTN